MFQLFYFIYFSFGVLVFTFVLLALLLCFACLFAEGAAASTHSLALCRVVLNVALIQHSKDLLDYMLGKSV